MAAAQTITALASPSFIYDQAYGAREDLFCPPELQLESLQQGGLAQVPA